MYSFDKYKKFNNKILHIGPILKEQDSIRDKSISNDNTNQKCQTFDFNMLTKKNVIIDINIKNSYKNIKKS